MTEGEQVKVCKRCGRYLPTSSFHKDKYRSDGLSFYCKDCKIVAAVEWGKRNPDKRKAHREKWDKNNIEKRVAASAKGTERFLKRMARLIQWRDKNPDRVAVARRERQRSEKYKSYSREWQISHRKYYADRAAHRRLTLDRYYVACLFVKGTTIRTSDVPDCIIEIHREHLRLTRKLKELNKC